MIMVFYQA